MTFKVVWSDEARKSLEKLERDLIIWMINKVEDIKEKPVAYLKRLVGKGIWRLRVGDYRVLIDLDNKKEILSVIQVGHRKNIYKKK